jgi:hypothetical protein
MDDTKSNENKINSQKTHYKSHEKTDLVLFDETLKLIEKTLKNLEEKIDSQENIEINQETKKQVSEKEEHIIDNTHLKMNELHNFGPEIEIKKKSFFGFYTYLAVFVIIIFGIYEVLNISKSVIILKYPVSEPYIEYIFEVVEILAYLVMNTVSFIKNLL